MAKNLVERKPEADELRILQTRLAQCTAMQELAETNHPKNCKKFTENMHALRDYHDQMPQGLRARVTCFHVSWGIEECMRISPDEAETRMSFLVQNHLPYLGATPWSGRDPQTAGTDDLGQKALECSELLKAGRFR